MYRTHSRKPDERQSQTDRKVVPLGPRPDSRSVMIEVQRNTSHEGRLPKVDDSKPDRLCQPPTTHSNTSLAWRDPQLARNSPIHSKPSMSDPRGLQQSPARSLRISLD